MDRPQPDVIPGRLSAAEIERNFAKGEVGPKYRGRQLERIEVELAELLRERDLLADTGNAKG